MPTKYNISDCCKWKKPEKISLTNTTSPYKYIKPSIDIPQAYSPQEIGLNSYPEFNTGAGIGLPKLDDPGRPSYTPYNALSSNSLSEVGQVNIPQLNYSFSGNNDAFGTSALNLVSKQNLLKPKKKTKLGGEKELGGSDSFLGESSIGMELGSRAVGGIADTLLSGFGNKKTNEAAYNGDPFSEIDDKQYKTGNALKGTGKGFKAGLSVPGGPLTKLIAGGVGALAGGFGSLIGSNKKLAEMKKQQQLDLRKHQTGKRFDKQQELTDRSNAILMSRKGGILKDIYDIPKFGYVPKVTDEFETRRTPVKTPVFKRGGVIDRVNNVIPNGVSHEEENKLGNKGMPVVKCHNNSCEKIYEIESDELIFTKETTEAIEELVKDKEYEKLGDFVLNQIINNTHSYTNTYKHLND